MKILNFVNKFGLDFTVSAKHDGTLLMGSPVEGGLLSLSKIVSVTVKDTKAYKRFREKFDAKEGEPLVKTLRVFLLMMDKEPMKSNFRMDENKFMKELVSIFSKNERNNAIVEYKENFPLLVTFEKLMFVIAPNLPEIEEEEEEL